MKSLIIWIVIIILVVLGVMWVRKPAVLVPPTDPGTTTTTVTPTTLPPTAEFLVPTASVAIENFAFSPKTVTVKKGTSVTWTNKDSAPHTVSVVGGAGPSSVSLATGATFSFTFDTVGVFQYTCSLHPSMQGTVVVTE
ncbi:MAG: cupredoxin domain-containing protein [Candidatus Campbellbacteria bacterium]|nr:cupredoxin domain-containing protein [Candidatus Campbellbacteria bacterium]